MTTPPPAASTGSDTGGDSDASSSSSDFITYGSYELRRDDRDRVPSNGGAPRWGGQDGATRYDNSEDLTEAGQVWNVFSYGWREDVEQGMNNVLSVPAYVTELQDDLMELGFGVIREANGVFGLHTEWAVREFQIYAGMEKLARDSAPGEETAPGGRPYLDRLEQVENDQVYDGPISGVTNAATRRRIKHWIDENYRCPVVIQARTGEDHAEIYGGGGLADGTQANNLWRHDDLQTSAPRVFAVDLSGYYNLPEQPDENDVVHNGVRFLALGQYRTYGGWYGMVADPDYDQIWVSPGQSAEVTPQLLTGQDDPTGATEDTFKVVHAVSEIECYGHLDTLNAYDRALLSAGTFHWTLGLFDNDYTDGDPDATIGKGELCAFLAYLRHADEAAYNRTLGNFGVGIDEEWGQTGAGLGVERTRKYVAWLEKQVEGGDYETLSLGTEGDANSIIDAIGEALYFRSWHWFYRFAMASRTIEGFQRATWVFSRMRLRDILGTSFSTPEWASWPGDPTTGDIFTSQKAAAMLLRWHVYLPARVVNTNDASGWVESALSHARDDNSNISDTAWALPPGQWNDEQESALVDGLVNTVEDLVAWYDREYEIDVSNLADTIIRVYRGDQSGGTGVALDDARGSFNLDRSGLPTAPW